MLNLEDAGYQIVNSTPSWLRPFAKRSAKRQPPVIIRNVSLKIPRGEVTAVVGFSGSGKTTLLNLLGLLADARGQLGKVTYDDGVRPHDYASLKDTARGRLRLRQFGFVLQSSYMLRHFTCGQNIAMPMKLLKWPESEQRERVAELLTQADSHGELPKLKNRLPRNVSGGQRQRMAVLRAVAHDPQVVFADEPISNLDPENSRLILDLLERWQAGDLSAHRDSQDDAVSRDKSRTLIIVSHSIRIAWKLAQNFIIMSRRSDQGVDDDGVDPRVVSGGPNGDDNGPLGADQIEFLTKAELGDVAELNRRLGYHDDCAVER